MVLHGNMKGKSDREKKNRFFCEKSILHITKVKKAVIIGRGTYWYNPSDTVSALRQLEMRIEAAILYDNLTIRKKRNIATSWKRSQFSLWRAGRMGIDRCCRYTFDDEWNTRKRNNFYTYGTDGWYKWRSMIFRALYRLLAAMGIRGLPCNHLSGKIPATG